MNEKGRVVNTRPFLSRPIFEYSLALLAVLIISAACTHGENEVIADGLAAPRGLSLDRDGKLLVAEAGGGRILKIDTDGDLHVLVSGLPHSLDAGPGSAYPAGPSATGFLYGQLHTVISEFKGDRFTRIYRVTDGDHEAVTPPTDHLSTAQDRFSNPYDMVPAPEIGGWIVSDGGRNAILAVDGEGRIRDYFKFQDFQYSDDFIEMVPTGITRGPDNAIYVGTLTGFPYPPEQAVVWRLEDSNADGDAMDLGEVEVFASGFTTVTDIAFDDKGILYVAEFSSDMQNVIRGGDIRGNAPDFPGRILTWDGTRRAVLKEGLVSPTGITVKGDGLYVSEEFTGRIRRIAVRD